MKTWYRIIELTTVLEKSIPQYWRRAYHSIGEEHNTELEKNIPRYCKRAYHSIARELTTVLQESLPQYCKSELPQYGKTRISQYHIEECRCTTKCASHSTTKSVAASSHVARHYNQLPNCLLGSFIKEFLNTERKSSNVFRISLFFSYPLPLLLSFALYAFCFPLGTRLYYS